MNSPEVTWLARAGTGIWTRQFGGRIPRGGMLKQLYSQTGPSRFYAVFSFLFTSIVSGSESLGERKRRYELAPKGEVGCSGLLSGPQDAFSD